MGGIELAAHHPQSRFDLRPIHTNKCTLGGATEFRETAEVPVFPDWAGGSALELGQDLRR